MMDSLPDQFHALVIGASGSIGAAFVETAAIKVARQQKYSVLVALHPGTVNSRLSLPFRGAAIGRRACDAAADMLQLLDTLTPADSGSFRSYNGAELPW
jgi:hypothetical protein